MSEKSIIQSGSHSVYIEQNNGNVFLDAIGGGLDYRQVFHDISTDLRSWRNVLYAKKHIPRQQTDSLVTWIEADHDKPEQRVALLVGAPGSGKSVVMHDLLQHYEEKDDVYVLGLKSDQIGVESVEEMAQQSGISKRMEEVIRELNALKNVKRVVILVDQIDALSLTLSSNRKTLRSILRFVENIQNLNQVRVVVSCRPYDLEYDPFLEQMQFGERVQMEPLRPETVEEVLRDNDRRVVQQGTNLFNTLRTPLFLYLFLKIKDDGNPFDSTLTEHGLYGKLWKQTIEDPFNDNPESRVQFGRLIALLDLVTSRMYEAQSLTLNRQGIDSSFSHELDYLLHEDILVQVSESRIQFFHQSLFDYIYARRFVERGEDLLATIKGKHQGLFIRARVKSVLMYMREVDSATYIRVVRSLLFDKNLDGKDTYRFHLKALVLSMMGYTPQPNAEEIRFVREELAENKQYLTLFVKGIRSGGWFLEVQQIINHQGGWKAMPESDSLLMIGICSQMVFVDQYLVFSYFDKYVTKDMPESLKNEVVHILNSFKPSTDNLKLTENLYDRLIVEKGDTSLSNYLRIISDFDVDFVLSRLRRIVSVAIENGLKEKYINDIRLSHEIDHIYDHLHQAHPDKLYDEFLSIVEEICEASKSEFSDSLIESSVYATFLPIVNPRIGYKFSDDILSILIEGTNQKARDEEPDIVERVCKLNQSKYDTIRVIAACAYDENPELFKDQILGVFTDSWVLSNSSGLLKYYYRKVLGKSFESYSHEEQSRILTAIMNSARTFEKRYTIKDHQKWGIGISLIDELKFEYLSEVPDGILKKEFGDIYKKKQEYLRRFGVRENQKPYRVTTKVGWASIDPGPDGEKKMTSKDWLDAMRKYKTDVTMSFYDPTLHGNAQLFQTHVGKSPDKYLGAIKTAMKDPSISQEYAYAGLKGLIDASYDFTVVEELFVQMLEGLNPDINANSPAEVIFLVRQSDYFIKNSKSLNEKILTFLTTVVREYNDVREDRGEDLFEKEPFQSGINEVRGSACEYLLECYEFKEYKEQIFSAFETLPGHATIHTRAALLLKMALLNYLDPNRSLSLFLNLMSDYCPSLMSMPLHNLNPLIYYINYGYKQLIPFFEKAIETPFCHREMAPLFWLAAAKKKEGADRLLRRLLDESNVAKDSLISYFVQSYDQKISPDLVFPWVRICFFAKQTDTELAKTYDRIFNNLIKGWQDEERKEMTFLFINGGWVANGHRDFIDYLGSMALTESSECLKLLRMTLEKAPDLRKDNYIMSKIIGILIQAYNGLSDFSSKTMDIEFAMDLLDSIVCKQEQVSSLNVFLYHLDNA